ncbi:MULTISPECIES: glutathione peroxidase [Marinobacter]|uniref:glutathione peroxidase n=1 Tax=Marinobacter TaxID=2742 RepID=UPI001E50836D|nr:MULTISPECIES: glutathione peroxidase [Marinobacter]MDX5439959.1 glutathione peroxidase [Alteromonadaceae bacterium]MCD1628377.1 glutathione peroxidase [Marinobacter shengliensis]MDX5336707.1 glutathione peroxidase [Marinobacter sp.]MDX5387867.1 glutathione peroxidase [Marinobacter sp.]MDX5473161.1 glutathione peroxidase [Marinobacter sp.]
MSGESIYDFSVRDIKGNEASMADYKGKVLLIVNTASKCGFTPQFEGLQALHEELGDRGFEVLGFPCNQFMNQDPANEDAISQFCSLNYGVSFPMFAKVDVNGDGAHPLFQFLKREARGLMGSEKVKWNFTKFLVNRDGQVIRRYAPTAKPADIRADIEKLL